MLTQNKSNKFIEIFYLIILFTLIFVLFFISKENLYNEVSDIGREFYIPQQILQGKILYKDIFNIYTPLSYYLNAVIVYVFGDTINTYCYIGLFLSNLSIIPIYLISKSFTNKHIAFLVCIAVLFTCTFYRSLSNWITPYTYAIMYSLVGILWALYFLFKFYDKNINKYLYYCTLLYGFSIACKYEFVLFIIVIFIVLKKKNSPNLLYLHSFILSTLFLLISFIYLFYQCSDTTLILNFFKQILAHSSNSHHIAFMKFVGHFLSSNSIELYENINVETAFSLFGIITLLTIPVLIIKKIDFKLKLLCLSAILLCIKVIFFISLNVYGTFFLPFLLIYITSLLYSRDRLKLITILFLAVIIIIYASSLLRHRNDFYELIVNNKTKIKIEIYKYESIKDLIEFINSETKENDKILVIPEGVLINYLTHRETDSNLFQLIPVNCDLMTYNYIKNKINDDNFNYIIISDWNYVFFGVDTFSDSWGKDIFNSVIKQKYFLYKTVGDNSHKYEIYKIKGM